MKYRAIVEIEDKYIKIYKDFDTAQVAANFCESVLSSTVLDYKEEPQKITAHIEFIPNEEEITNE